MKRVILIGDSIRMGYQPIVQHELQGVAEVSGPEQNGGTSRNVRANLEEWVLAAAPNLVHVNCGLHDIKKPLDSDVFEIPLDEYKENIRDILQRLKNSGTIVIWAT